jgi:excisionase family DNA binding protein
MPSDIKPTTKLLKTSDLARLCQVDVKTIHNWCEADKLPHMRTPGRHLRFRAEDVVAFLQKYGYPVPRELDGGPAPVRYVIKLGDAFYWQDTDKYWTMIRAEATRFDWTGADGATYTLNRVIAKQQHQPGLSLRGVNPHVVRLRRRGVPR